MGQILFNSLGQVPCPENLNRFSLNVPIFKHSKVKEQGVDGGDPIQVGILMKHHVPLHDVRLAELDVSLSYPSPIPLLGLYSEFYRKTITYPPLFPQAPMVLCRSYFFCLFFFQLHKWKSPRSVVYIVNGEGLNVAKAKECHHVICRAETKTESIVRRRTICGGLQFFCIIKDNNS